MIPTYVGPPAVPAQAPPAKLDHTETAKIRKAMHAVTHQHPGAAGKILAAYLSDWHDWAYRVDQTNLAAQLVADVLAQLPEQR